MSANSKSDLPAFTVAFQPIVALKTRWEIYAYEALVRGVDGESAAEILGQVAPHQKYQFDAACRHRAIELAAAANMPHVLSLNIPPEIVTAPEVGLGATLKKAQTVGFPLDRLMIELTESSVFDELDALAPYLKSCRKRGVMVGLDDFGSEHNCFRRLVALNPDFIKIDRTLMLSVAKNKKWHSVLSGLVDGCRSAGISVVAEGLETAQDVDAMQAVGVTQMQGYYFGKPMIEHFSNLP